jgi:hypothetical protein
MKTRMDVNAKLSLSKNLCKIAEWLLDVNIASI